MENKTELIERLRKIANELEQDLKPKFEVGKVYYSESHKIYVTNCDNIDSVIGYGFTDNEWRTFKDFSLGDVSYEKLISCPSELWKEALTKEYYKRGYERGKFIDLEKNNITNTCEKADILFQLTCNGLWVQGCGYVMQNGIWATVIKERSLDEWYKSFINSPLGVAEYIKSTKTELIQILNNLPND